MSREFLIASELAAIFAPSAAIVCGALLPNEKSKSKLLLSGHLAALLLSVIALVSVLNQPHETSIFGQGWTQIHIDQLSILLLSGISFISTIVLTFSERYLSGDKATLNFLYLTSILSSLSAILVVTDSLVVGLLCWHLLSLTLWRVMCVQACKKDSAKIVLRHHLSSDVLMATAMAILLMLCGDITFSELPNKLTNLSATKNLQGTELSIAPQTIISLLLVLSFSIKSALFPFHRWLLATLDGPTPLSGLLHAGVVNVSAVMACRLMPLLSQCPDVLFFWGCLAAVSAVVGTLSMSCQPDIKRKLVYSTVGQMGFMSLQCAAGALACALFHLLAHGLFKCHMFLQSGSAVAEGISKKKYAYGEPNGKSMEPRAVALVTLATIAFCSLLVTICHNSGWAAVSALIASAAFLCHISSVSRVNVLSVTLFWLGTLALAFVGISANLHFENILPMQQGTTAWILPACIVLFATITLSMWLIRKTELFKSLYVHSLNAFYLDEIVLAASNRLRMKINSY